MENFHHEQVVLNSVPVRKEGLLRCGRPAMGKGKGRHGERGPSPRRQREHGRQQHRYGDPGWEQQFRQLSEQLRALNLRIKSIAGDGSFIFLPRVQTVPPVGVRVSI